MASTTVTRREQYNLLRSTLHTDRESFKADWKDLANYILPRRPQFVITDTHQGGRRNQKIINSTGTLAARTLRAGMMGGITSPARPWFKLGAQDPEMSEYAPRSPYTSGKALYRLLLSIAVCIRSVTVCNHCFTGPYSLISGSCAPSLNQGRAGLVIPPIMPARSVRAAKVPVELIIF